MVVAALLLLVIVWVALRLACACAAASSAAGCWSSWRRSSRWSGFVPGMLIYVVSYQFVSRSIESWFDVKVEGALDAGLNLGRATLDTLANDLANKTRAAGAQLAELPDAARRAGAGAHARAAGGQRRGAVERQRPADRQRRPVALPAQPRAADAAAAAHGAQRPRASRAIEGLDESPQPSASAPMRASRRWRWCQRPGFGLLAEPRFLQVTQALPPALVANALAVQEANREYQERALAREGLRRMYIGTLTLEPVPGGVRRGAAGRDAGQPARAAAAAAGRRRAQVAAGDLRPRPRCRARTNWAA